jgi:predicted metal-dependent hydrolase
MKLHRLGATSPKAFHATIAAVESPEFQRGIALFNSAKFFEAHEVLEDTWRPMDLSDPSRIAMQGIVQVAVALHHQFTGNRAGALSVMRRAARNLALANDHAFGVRIDRLRPALNDWIHAFERYGNPQAPKIEFLRDAE